MAAIYRFLASYEVLIYIALAIGGLFSLRWLWYSWREWRQAVYRLEREFSARRLGQASALSILILLLFCSVLFITSFLIPGLPAEVFLSTPTLDLLSVPVGTLAPEMMTQFAALPPGTFTAASAGCIPDQLIVTSPEPGEELKGTVEITGTVNTQNFGFYKYEVAPQGANTWATISAGREVVRNGILGRWDTSALIPGDYQLRLVVTDNQGSSLPPCIVPVRVVSGQ